MQLFEKVKQDRMSARKAKDEVITSVLTTLVGELEGQAKRKGTDVTDEMVVSACKKFISDNSDTIKLTADTIAAGKLTAENVALNSYLPSQLTSDQIRSIIIQLNMPNLGLVMKHLKDNYAGQYDGKVASAVAKELVG